ncbi:MAG: hypothetical protein PVH88_25435 [Ignavibacteria bacterium]|jgi:hypothetical protein
MKQKIKKSVLAGIILCVFNSLFLLTDTYSGGSEEPYKIATTDDLIELSNTSGDWGTYSMEPAHISFTADETRVDWRGDGYPILGW